MKFAYTTELERFLRQENVFPQLRKLQEIRQGGSSYNFVVETENKKYLLKLITSEQHLEVKRLISILKKINFICDIKENLFMSYYMIVMPYINGKKFKYKNCTVENLSQLASVYQTLVGSSFNPEDINERQTAKQLQKAITEMIASENTFLWRIIKKYFWQPLQSKLLHFPDCKSVIHGDFSANNILFDGKQSLHIIDVAGLRYGYPAEDMAFLFLQLAGFRGFFGSLRRFEKLRSSLPMEISSEMWLYGTELFYLNMLNRRLLNNKKKRFRKDLCLFIILMGYFRLARYLNNH